MFSFFFWRFKGVPLSLRGEKEISSYRELGETPIEREREMIRAVMVINTQGKPRLAKFYDVQVSPLLKYLHSIPFLFFTVPVPLGFLISLPRISLISSRFRFRSPASRLSILGLSLWRNNKSSFAMSMEVLSLFIHCIIRFCS